MGSLSQFHSGRAAFHEPVKLRLGGARVAEISTAEEASAALHGEWPPTRGKWYYAASRACSAAMEGRTSPHVARRIFMEAVQESRLDA